MSPPLPPSDYQPPVQTWVAWRKAQGGRWQRVGFGTEREAWDAVYRAMDASPRTGAFSSVVLKDGEKP